MTRMHAAHWGSFTAERDGDRLTLTPAARDGDPSPMLQGMADYLTHETRIRRPAIREGWLRAGPRGKSGERGSDPFVEVDWDTALGFVATEIDRVRREHGSDTIFAGSYGWSSAGRFHHAKSQLRRFINLAGGCVEQVTNYSFGAGMILLPHVIGSDQMVFGKLTGWDAIIANTETFLSFGGLPARNGQIESGGTGAHVQRAFREAFVAKGGTLINASPLRSDTAEATEWLPVRPGTDTALILALCHELEVQGLTDHAFLSRYTHGHATFRAHLRAGNAGGPHSAEWAAQICGLPAQRIRDLARQLAVTRSFINVNWSLQRAEFGEQTYWAAIALAAMLGQIGLPGGGIGFGYGSMNGNGNPVQRLPSPSLPTPKNPIGKFIPVARITELFLGELRDMPFNGTRLTLPATRLIYWAGGNPFHHHQNLNRLHEAWQLPDTVIVQDHVWTATARRADIVLPATMSLERDDISASSTDRYLSAMHKVTEPVGEARDDYEIFTDLARRLGFEAALTEGRSGLDWVRHLYETTRTGAAPLGVALPEFDDWWQAGSFEKPLTPAPLDALAEFRANPEAAPLATPSGRIELWSEVIEGFGLPDCPGGPSWLAPRENLCTPLARRFPLHLLSPQPAHRLHSQLDPVGVSARAKIEGREPIRMSPQDAAARGLVAGQIVRVFNDRGACLAGLVISDDLIPGVVELPTGAWFDSIRLPDGTPLEIHGNPNALTSDRPTSSLSQGSAAQSCLVEIEAWTKPLPPLRVHRAPELLSSAAGEALLAARGK